jgi:hypothetical protein
MDTTTETAAAIEDDNKPGGSINASAAMYDGQTGRGLINGCFPPLSAWQKKGLCIIFGGDDHDGDDDDDDDDDDDHDGDDNDNDNDGKAPHHRAPATTRTVLSSRWMPPKIQHCSAPKPPKKDSRTIPSPTK